MSPNYYKVFSGYQYVGDAPFFILFLPTTCLACKAKVALNELNIREEKEGNLSDAGICRHPSPRPPSGFQVSTEGPILCKVCLEKDFEDFENV